MEELEDAYKDRAGYKKIMEEISSLREQVENIKKDCAKFYSPSAYGVPSIPDD